MRSGLCTKHSPLGSGGCYDVKWVWLGGTQRHIGVGTLPFVAEGKFSHFKGYADRTNWRTLFIFPLQLGKLANAGELSLQIGFGAAHVVIQMGIRQPDQHEAKDRSGERAQEGAAFAQREN